MLGEGKGEETIFGSHIICYHHDLICIKHLICVRMHEFLPSGWELGRRPVPRSAGHGILP